MGLHPEFPGSPYVVVDPAVRWFAADEAMRQRADQLMPPMVPALRRKVKEWRANGYAGAAETSRALLQWWFETEHLMATGPSSQGMADGSMVAFEYYFAQREAVETIVYLHDVAGVQDKYDLMKVAESRAVSAGMFDEDWRRWVVKMATGAGKTKVLSLVLAWSYFHKLYERESDLARNFLVIAPNIIVLDRLYKDFAGLRIFLKDDPVLPDNGYAGQNWRDDFQLTLHVQDEARVTNPVGNIFLTNIHRVYAGNETTPSADDDDTMDYFLGRRPTGATTDSKVDLGVIVREIDELVVLNDEAHHIHDKETEWFKSIQDIDNRLRMKDARLSLQIDVTATPKHNRGAVFVQTVSDYPLVEAIAQNVVKHPVLPDASRAKLQARESVKFTERWADYIHLGVLEWRKVYGVHEKLGKKAILFVMTDDTKNCDDVAAYLEGNYPELKGAVLTIHTKPNGEISESVAGKNKDELEKLRKEANGIDSWDSPHKAVVSVMMLKEGWDVRNVTTIVGLRAYAALSNILPEQTLGRGLRKMYAGGLKESVIVLGTPAFMDFVEGITAEGVPLEHKPMDAGTRGYAPLIVEVDGDKSEEELEALDFELPVLTPRVYREFKSLTELDVKAVGFQRVIYREFSEEEQREIVFWDVAMKERTHTTILDTAGVADYRSVIGYFAQMMMRELRLVSGYDVLYGKVKQFVRCELFGREVDLEDPNTLRNLSEMEARVAIVDGFKQAINALTVREKGDAEIRDRITLRKTRPFVVGEQGYLVSGKSLFNRTVGDSGLELDFAAFLAKCGDVTSFARNYFAVGFKLDYVRANGEISNYTPDFFVRTGDGVVWIVETKGREDVDDSGKRERLKQWCADASRLDGRQYRSLFVREEDWERYAPKTFRDAVAAFGVGC